MGRSEVGLMVFLKGGLTHCGIHWLTAVKWKFGHRCHSRLDSMSNQPSRLIRSTWTERRERTKMRSHSSSISTQLTGTTKCYFFEDTTMFNGNWPNLISFFESAPNRWHQSSRQFTSRWVTVMYPSSKMLASYIFFRHYVTGVNFIMLESRILKLTHETWWGKKIYEASILLLR